MFDLIKPFLSAEFIGKMVRTSIQSAMGGLIASGALTGDQVQTIAGSIGLAAATLWTAFAHSKAAAKYGVEPNSTTGGLL